MASPSAPTPTSISKVDAYSLLKAVTFATLKHHGKVRKCEGAPPYIVHPLRVCQTVSCVPGEHDNLALMQAALLHDTVEDTDTTFDEIEREFGIRVRAIVAEVTDDKSRPRDERRRLQAEHAPHCCREAHLIKLADKIDNIEDLVLNPSGIPVGWDPARVQDYCITALRVTNSIKGVCPLLDTRLRRLTEGTFLHTDGKTYPILPTQAQQEFQEQQARILADLDAELAKQAAAEIVKQKAAEIMREMLVAEEMARMTL